MEERTLTDPGEVRRNYRLPKSMSSIISTTNSADSSHESSRRNSLSEKEIEKLTMTTYPHMVGEHKSMGGSRTPLKDARKDLAWKFFPLDRLSVKEVKEELEGEKKNSHKPRRQLHMMNDNVETVPKWSLTRTERSNSFDHTSGPLFKVDEDVGEDEHRNRIPSIGGKIRVFDKNEFNRSGKDQSNTTNEGARLNRHCSSILVDNDDIIEEDLSFEGVPSDREDKDKQMKMKWLTPQYKKRTILFPMTLKVDEVEKKAMEKKERIQPPHEDQSPVREVIEEEKTEENALQKLNNAGGGVAQKRVFLQKIIKGEQMGEWDTLPLEYLNREHSLSTANVEPIEEITPNMVPNEDKDDDKD